MGTPTLRLTLAQALVRYLCAQRVELDGREVPLFGGVFAIFGHGNVAGLGEALLQVRETLPTFRAHNEQAMGHMAVAYAKTLMRRRVMACTTSVGPGATNLVTAAATAHVNRLPLLLLPGDTFASRLPDPVLQQVEDAGDALVTANDCLRPVSRYFDRLTRPEQLLAALPQAMRVLTDPADCGPVTLALPQDVQAEAYDYPASFFEPRLHLARRPRPDRAELSRAVDRLRRAERPLVIAGGGVLYSEASAALGALAERCRLPVAETQAGKGALRWDHPWSVGAIGVTGSAAANALAREADAVLCVGTRLADFTTGSRALFQDAGVDFIGLNAAPFDAVKHRALALVADAREGLAELEQALGAWQSPAAWSERVRTLQAAWNAEVDAAVAPPAGGLPNDAQVLGAVNRAAGAEDVVVCAAGGLPGELHKLWRAAGPGSYHVEYGYSCMGYELAGGVGVRLAREGRGEVFVLVGDGSYLMMNSELATAAALRLRLVVVLRDNHGFGCIHRLQRSTGSPEFNNLLAVDGGAPPVIDFVAHAASLGAHAERVPSVAELPGAVERSRGRAGPSVLVIETDGRAGSGVGGAWWDVPVAEVSPRAEVGAARVAYERQRLRQRRG